MNMAGIALFLPMAMKPGAIPSPPQWSGKWIVEQEKTTLGARVSNYSLGTQRIQGSTRPRWRWRCEMSLRGFWILTGFQSEEGSYSASLEISAVEKKDLAATYSLNVTNPYGSQVREVV